MHPQTLVELRNPYLEVFFKYVQKSNEVFGWESKTNWRYGDGFSGPAWSQSLVDDINTRHARERLTSYMAWAVPNDEAIQAIADLGSPVVEIGAGTGYWAWLLRQVGVEVYAYDIEPDGNHWCEGIHWVPVKKGGPTAVLKHPDAALMLCWPPLGKPMAYVSLQKYKGDTLIYIGETGGCCADDDFFEEMANHWRLERTVDIPQWPGMYDYLEIYRKGEQDGPVRPYQDAGGPGAPDGTRRDVYG